MLSNDILRSVRYILKANNNDLVRILALGNVEATAEQIAVWLRKEDEEGFQRCPDIVLSSFLNGLIYEKRGRMSLLRHWSRNVALITTSC